MKYITIIEWPTELFNNIVEMCKDSEMCTDVVVKSDSFSMHTFSTLWGEGEELINSYQPDSD